MKYVRKRGEHVLVLVPHVSSWAYLHDRIYILWDTIRSVWEWDVELGLWADICFMKEYWTAVKLLSAHSNNHFSLSLIFGCATESRLPLIFTLMLWVNAGNTQMIHSAWLDTQQTLGSLMVWATSINNHIDTSLSSTTRFVCNLVLFLPKRSKPIFLFGPVFFYEKLSVIKR